MPTVENVDKNWEGFSEVRLGAWNGHVQSSD